MCLFDRSPSRSEGRSGETRSCFRSDQSKPSNKSASISPLPHLIPNPQARSPLPDPQILRATPADAPALSRLSAEVFPLGCPVNTPPVDLADYISREHTPERYLAMLQDDR